jgi:hypothetical protein
MPWRLSNAQILNFYFLSNIAKKDYFKGNVCLLSLINDLSSFFATPFLSLRK